MRQLMVTLCLHRLLHFQDWGVSPNGIEGELYDLGIYNPMKTEERPLSLLRSTIFVKCSKRDLDLKLLGLNIFSIGPKHNVLIMH